MFLVERTLIIVLTLTFTSVRCTLSDELANSTGFNAMGKVTNFHFDISSSTKNDVDREKDISRVEFNYVQSEVKPDENSYSVTESQDFAAFDDYHGKLEQFVSGKMGKKRETYTTDTRTALQASEMCPPNQVLIRAICRIIFD